VRLLTIGLILFTSLQAATVDGVKLHSTVTGKGPKTVILVHGWTCDDTTWTSQVPALSKDYRVVTLDLPGHGQSGSPKDGKLTMELFARAVESVRAETKANRVVIAGHSMGTPVIVEYARLYPQHVAAMVFVDGLVTMGNIQPAGGPPAGNRMAGPDGAKAREQMIHGMFSASTTPDMQKHILGMMMGASEATAVGARNATFDPAVWKNDTFTQPILGLYADHSQIANHDYMKAHFPNLEYHEIPGTGHFLMLEKPEEFNALLMPFLAKQKF
jgi:pimeloyl-ACP methyl ester carboxylesterase